MFAVQLDVHCTLCSLYNMVFTVQRDVYISGFDVLEHRFNFVVDECETLHGFLLKYTCSQNCQAVLDVIHGFTPRGYSLINIHCYVLASCYAKK